MSNQLSHLEQVKRDAEYITRKRIREQQEANMYAETGEIPVDLKPVEKPKEQAPKVLSQMNKQELLDLAAEKDVTVTDGATNKELREVIRSAEQERK